MRIDGFKDLLSCALPHHAGLHSYRITGVCVSVHVKTDSLWETVSRSQSIASILPGPEVMPMVSDDAEQVSMVEFDGRKHESSGAAGSAYDEDDMDDQPRVGCATH